MRNTTLRRDTASLSRGRLSPFALTCRVFFPRHVTHTSSSPPPSYPTPHFTYKGVSAVRLSLAMPRDAPLSSGQWNNSDISSVSRVVLRCELVSWMSYGIWLLFIVRIAMMLICFPSFLITCLSSKDTIKLSEAINVRRFLFIWCFFNRCL